MVPFAACAMSVEAEAATGSVDVMVAADNAAAIRNCRISSPSSGLGGFYGEIDPGHGRGGPMPRRIFPAIERLPRHSHAAAGPH